MRVRLEQLPEFKLAPPPAEEAFGEVRFRFGDRLPAEYAEFLQGHDGGEGFIGKNYARLFNVAELLETNEDADEFFEGWLIWGSNGGGEAFVFDASGEVLMVPWISAREDAIPQGRLPEFLERLVADTIFKDVDGLAG